MDMDHEPTLLNYYGPGEGPAKEEVGNFQNGLPLTNGIGQGGCRDPRVRDPRLMAHS